VNILYFAIIHCFRSKYSKTWVQTPHSAIKTKKIQSSTRRAETRINFYTDSIRDQHPKLGKIIRFPLYRNFGMSFGRFCQTRSFCPGKFRAKFRTPKFRMLIPREKVDSGFCLPGRTLKFRSSFLSCVGLEPRIFGLKVDAGDK
jgi:hypothetical protein